MKWIGSARLAVFLIPALLKVIWSHGVVNEETHTAKRTHKDAESVE